MADQADYSVSLYVITFSKSIWAVIGLNAFFVLTAVLSGTAELSI